MRKLICICILTAVFLSALTGCGNKVVDNDIEKPNEEDVRRSITRIHPIFGVMCTTSPISGKK